MNQYFSIEKISKKSVLNHLTLIVLGLILFSCSSVKQLAVEKDVSGILKNSDVFSGHFTGFSLFDIEKNQYIADHNSTLRFTPASNTKLLTMYAVLKTFNDSIPALLINQVNNKTLIRPIGEPTFLYREFEHQPIYSFLSSRDSIFISFPEKSIPPFGNGWAWDDYIYDYQPQRCWWPIYGNTVSIKKEDTLLTITPRFFEEFVEIENQVRPGELVDREVRFNLFKAYLESDTSDFERIIPFEYSSELLLQLLSDTLRIPVSFSREIFTPSDTLFSQHVDTVLSKMMKPSDNFLAEQLLVLAAWKNGFSEIRPFINYVKTIWLPDMNEMVWVDGSGLSRYNLITPVDQVRLLRKCYEEFGWDRVTNLLATGGEGTLEELYLAEEPYIFAKTGTLSNNHSLSGYLITKSGKRLIFSLMNNHYVRPTDEVKRTMEQFINDLRDAY